MNRRSVLLLNCYTCDARVPRAAFRCPWCLVPIIASTRSSIAAQPERKSVPSSDEHSPYIRGRTT